MDSILIEVDSSSKTCCFCDSNKLVESDMEDVVYYHCLACGGEFYESEQQRQAARLRERKDDRISWNLGFLVLTTMLVTVIAIKSDTRLERASTISPPMQSSIDVNNR